MDMNEIVKRYAEMAENGDAEAQFNLGKCYAKGKGVAMDKEEAFKWVLKAAEQGLAEAQFNIGYYFSTSRIKEEQPESVKWHLKAAEQNYGPSLYALGISYEIGFGVAKDEEESKKWYDLAKKQGFDKNIIRLDWFMRESCFSPKIISSPITPSAHNFNIDENAIISDENNDDFLDIEDDINEEERFKGSDLFIQWYYDVFLPNGGRIHSNDPHSLWDDLNGEFFDWLDRIKMKRKAEQEKNRKRTFDYWYKHVYQGEPPATSDPRDDKTIWHAYKAWDGITHFLDDISEEERQGWEDLYDKINFD
jgi:TPR repeat protein